jgi:hypothetical protein
MRVDHRRARLPSASEPFGSTITRFTSTAPRR